MRLPPIPIACAEHARHAIKTPSRGGGCAPLGRCFVDAGCRWEVSAPKPPKISSLPSSMPLLGAFTRATVGSSCMSVRITPRSSEPTATAPQPFVPQTVEVAPSTSGETLTLITTEAGGFTRNGDAFATGTGAMAEADGSTDMLALDGTT